LSGFDNGSPVTSEFSNLWKGKSLTVTS